MFNRIYFIHNPLSNSREKYINNIETSISNIPYFSKELTIKKIWKIGGNDLKEDELLFFKNGATSIRHFKNACSLVLNHIECLEDFICSNEEYTIVFEDDCYCDDVELLKITFENIQNNPDFDTVYLGDGCFPNANKDKPHGLLPVNQSRCTEAIVYSKKGAKKILDYYYKSREEKNVFCLLDFYFTECYNSIKDYKNFHTNPTPIHQATIYGLIQSSIKN